MKDPLLVGITDLRMTGPVVKDIRATSQDDPGSLHTMEEYLRWDVALM